MPTDPAATCFQCFIVGCCRLLNTMKLLCWQTKANDMVPEGEGGGGDIRAWGWGEEFNRTTCDSIIHHHALPYITTYHHPSTTTHRQHINMYTSSPITHHPSSTIHHHRTDTSEQRWVDDGHPVMRYVLVSRGGRGERHYDQHERCIGSDRHEARPGEGGQVSQEAQGEDDEGGGQSDDGFPVGQDAAVGGIEQPGDDGDRVSDDHQIGHLSTVREEEHEYGGSVVSFPTQQMLTQFFEIQFVDFQSTFDEHEYTVIDQDGHVSQHDDTNNESALLHSIRNANDTTTHDAVDKIETRPEHRRVTTAPTSITATSAFCPPFSVWCCFRVDSFVVHL